MRPTLCLFIFFCIGFISGFSQVNLIPGFSMFIGGSGYEQVRDVTTDCSGNIYITGGTSSPDYTTTPGTFGQKLNREGDNIMDAFVMKLTPDGNLIWSTLIGGPGYDRAYGIEVDDSGYVYVAGRAGKGLPTTHCSFQPSFGGDTDENRLYGKQDGFIAKLLPDGSTLIWCSYFGANDNGFIRDIALDKGNNIYIVMSETSAENPHISADALQTKNNGGYDAVIACISSDGRYVKWATYLGGSANDFFGPAIRINNKQQVVVTGNTFSADIPVTDHAFDKSYNGNSDIYIAILTDDGSRLLLGSYLGGDGDDGTETHNLVLDNDDNIIIAATTSSTGFPVTKHAYQPVYGGSGGSGTGLYTNYPGDGFVTKLSPDGSQLLASTFFGGTAGEGIEGVAIDDKGNIYCSGAGFSSNIPGKGKTVQKENNGKGDQFVICLNPSLDTLIYFGYGGGVDKDYGRSLHIDLWNNIYIVGETSSMLFPASNVFKGGPQDGTLIKLSSGRQITPSDCVEEKVFQSPCK